MSAETENQTEKKTAAEEQPPQTYQHVEGERGIYRYKDSGEKITYHERPWINGKRTWRALGFNFSAQSSLKLAREEYHRRRAQECAGKDPYAENTRSEPDPNPAANAAPNGNGTYQAVPATYNPAADASPVGKAEEKVDVRQELSISEVLTKYRDDGFLDKFLRTRKGRTLEMEARNCENMLEYFNGQPWDDLRPPLWDKYKDWRVKRPSKKELEKIEKDKQRKKAGLLVKKKKNRKRKKEVRTKHRAVDQERNTMVNAYRYAIRRGWIDINRASNLPKFQPASEVRHCREFSPRNPDELHKIAELLFAERSSEVLGWQLLFEANTGQRTEEILMLRTDAKPDHPGFIRSDGNMDVFRTKEGGNPYVFIHEGLKQLLKAHAVWKAIRYPKSPWFFPGREDPNRKPVDKEALGHALRRLRKKIGRKITSHGMRAFYVLIRRSHNITDPCIAWELGHTSGGILIAQVYGSIPSSWLSGGGPKLKWLPECPPAWEKIKPFTSWRFREGAAKASRAK